jgi:hypothetical protein
VEERVVAGGFLGAHRRDEEAGGRYRVFGVVHRPIMSVSVIAPRGSARLR